MGWCDVVVKEDKIYKGYWWLPENPDEKVAGTLTVLTDGTLVLELYGAFGLEEDGVDFKMKDNPAIFGR